GQRAPATHVCPRGRCRAAAGAAAGRIHAATTRKPMMSDLHARSFGRLAIVVATAMLLGACASMAPKYERPPAPVSPTFPEAPPAPSDGALAADIQWQDVFADPRLKRLIGVALDNNRDLRAAGLAIEQARAQYRIRRADQLPTVNAAAI